MSNFVLTRLKQREATPGFDQGFDVFEEIRDVRESPPGVEPNAVAVADCKAVFERGLQYVEAHQEERFFLWLFNLDPHAPYRPPPPYDTMYLDHPQLRADTVPVNTERVHKQAFVASRTMKHEYVARHMGEVTMIDAWIGKLLERLRLLPGNTLVVITADHGESFGDSDYWFAHGGNTRHPCVNVPLIIACEGTIPSGMCEALVANIDVAPTILDVLGLPYEGLSPDGRSLVPTFAGVDPWPDRMVPLRSMAQHWRGARSKH
ncbi:MAG: sulfatase-like hydrolase/transferase, partial [bacterium]|nr:sulfatase-like hydrolase/transferase [bacterium]